MIDFREVRETAEKNAEALTQSFRLPAGLCLLVFVGLAVLDMYGGPMEQAVLTDTLTYSRVLGAAVVLWFGLSGFLQAEKERIVLRFRVNALEKAITDLHQQAEIDRVQEHRRRS